MTILLKRLLEWFWTAVRSVPWQFWALALAVALAWVYGEMRADQREAEVRGELSAALAEAQAEEAIHAAQTGQKAAEVTTRTVTEYVDRVKVIREKGETITKLVPVYVPLSELPGSWRVLHDSAASGIVPDPAGVADAPGTDTQALAATVTGNYTACHANAEQLTKLQDWVIEQAKLWQTSANSTGG